ncbi:MAG: LPS assembly protein LptD [Syntrophales bacterium]|jgi:LPS-assembly protein|nr:LPS assembly protein LptD [Syntrophales bacterium]MCK9527893.1 LPS assembly protein LptD [Syntrophales bacterium]MDX9921932.1 LPS assembly protein LptD [Syntrophales bacterium]
MFRFITASAVVFVLAVFWLLQPCLTMAQKNPSGPTHIEAERIRYISDPEGYEAEGDVVITFDGGYLKADRACLEVQSGDAGAEGNVFIQSGGDIMEGSRTVLNVNTKVGTIFDGRIFYDPSQVFLRGKTIEKRGEGEYRLLDAEVTTCCGDVPDWKITGRRINVAIDGYGTIRHGTFRIRDFPVLYIPWMIFPAKTTRQSGFLYPRIAYSSDKLGWDVGIPYYHVLSDAMDVTLFQRYMDKRGYQQGAEFRYFLGENSFGTFYADYLRDGMDITTRDGDGELFRDWRESRDRWSWYLDHESRFDSGLSIRANMKKISDNWYFRDFESHNYYSDHYGESGDRPFRRVDFTGDKNLAYLTSTVRLTKAWERFNITALGEYKDNLRLHSNERTLQKYPEITFTGMKQPFLNTPFDFEIDSSYGYYYRETGYRGHVFDAAPVISLPLRAGNYFRFIPEAGIRETRWDSKDSTGKQPGRRAGRTLYHVGSTLTSEVSRLFSVGKGSIDVVRHSIIPEISYRFSPYVSQDNRPDFVPFVDEENRVSYSINNTFTARLKDDEGVKSYRELANFKIGQSYNIREARRAVPAGGEKKKPFSEYDMELSLTPHPFVRFSGDASLDAYNSHWRILNGLLQLQDWRGDSATMEYRYTKNVVEQFDIGFNGRITDCLTLFLERIYDRMEKKGLETTYGVAYRKQCWDVVLKYTDSYDDRAFMLIITLAGLGTMPEITGSLPHGD